MTNEQTTFSEKWLGKRVKLKDTSDYELPRTNYSVTAALLNWDGDGETVFGIMSNEYQLPDKPWWFTLRFGKDKDANAHVNEHFDII